MAKFKMKPIVVDAIKLTDSNFDEIREFAGYKNESKLSHNYYNNESDLKNNKPSGLFIKTTNGTVVLHVGDWIIKDVLGNYSVCKPYVFKKKYESI